MWGDRVKTTTHPLEHQLSHPVPLLNPVLRLRMVEQQNPDLPSVIRIDDSGTRVDEMLGRETRARCYPSIWNRTKGQLLTPTLRVDLHGRRI